MILVDAGPLVAFFDPADTYHERCASTLSGIHEAMLTTVPALDETFHLLGAGSLGAARLRDFIRERGLGVWYLEPETVLRALELMDRYADHPMDFADASLVVAAEMTRVLRIFTTDRNDFLTYRARHGHHLRTFEMV